MKNVLYILLLLAFCGCSEPIHIVEVKVTNPTGLDRIKEFVELDLLHITSILGTDTFVILNQEDKQLPYQVTYDGKVIFPVSLSGNDSAFFSIKEGTPIEFRTLACGRHYPERLDDIAWENDRIAFRTYGPALQATGEKAYGYDVWVKKVHHPVVEERYATELNPDTRRRIAELRQEEPEAARLLEDSVSYHIDHGNGLDYYSVGPTLGAGTCGIWQDNTLVYPYCYKNYEILDNGPLRFTVRLTYHPLALKNNVQAVETRIISLDAWSQLNKITLSYDGIKEPVTVASGIVIHSPSEEFSIDADKGYMAYAEPVEAENGQTYIAVVNPGGMQDARAVFFSEEEAKERRAEGHLLAFHTYYPGTQYTYYAGAGWNKWGFASSFSWFKYIQHQTVKLKKPLIVEIQ